MNLLHDMLWEKCRRTAIVNLWHGIQFHKALRKNRIFHRLFNKTGPWAADGPDGRKVIAGFGCRCGRAESAGYHNSTARRQKVFGSGNRGRKYRESVESEPNQRKSSGLKGRSTTPTELKRSRGQTHIEATRALHGPFRLVRGVRASTLGNKCQRTHAGPA